jgi:hypothetical protein
VSGVGRGADLAVCGIARVRPLGTLREQMTGGRVIDVIGAAA